MEVNYWTAGVRRYLKAMTVIITKLVILPGIVPAHAQAICRGVRFVFLEAHFEGVRPRELGRFAGVRP